MSRFTVNKFMSFVEGSDQAVLDYVEDPTSYVQHWEGRAREHRLPLPDSAMFTDGERSALERRDHREIYRLGGHPYLLWHFVEAIRVWTGETTWPDMKEQFRSDIAGIETPDHTT